MPQSQDSDEWATCMREDEGLDDSDSESGEHGAHTLHLSSHNETELAQQALDISAVDESGITFSDNPFTKATRNAQLRKAAAKKSGTEPVSHAPASKAAGAPQNQIPRDRSSLTGVNTANAQRKDNERLLASSPVGLRAPSRMPQAPAYMHPYSHAPRQQLAATTAVTPASSSCRPGALPATIEISGPASVSVPTQRISGKLNNEAHTAAVSAQHPQETYDTNHGRFNSLILRDADTENNDGEGSPFAYNVQDSDRWNANLPTSVSKGSDGVPLHALYPLHPIAAASSDFSPSQQLSPVSSLTGIRPPLQPAWVRTHRAGPLAGRLAFEPVPADTLPSLKAAPLNGPSKHARDTVSARGTPSSVPSIGSSTLSSLSQFAFREGDVDREGFLRDQDGEIQEHWASSSSTMVPSSSPRPEPVQTRNMKLFTPVDTSSQMASMWPSLAAKYGRTRQILSQLNSDDLSMDANRSQNVRSVARKNDTGSASGATIRLSSTFKLPSLRLGGDKGHCGSGAGLGDQRGHDGGSNKRPRLASPNSRSEENRSPPAQRSGRSRMAFAPTPLERWKAECEQATDAAEP
ncbi:unnamed protein product [Tilletia caries]|nr:unnamed protein product [Tilletia caries]